MNTGNPILENMDITDLDRQAEEIGIDRNSLLSLYRVYMEETESDLVELSRMISGKRFGDVRAMAHHIKGASVNLEIDDLADAAASLEKLCESPSGQSLADSLDTMNFLFAELRRTVLEASRNG